MMRTTFGVVSAVIVAFCATQHCLAFTTTAVPPRPYSTTSTTTALAANIAVFGASGLTGSECVYQALQNGDTVVGLTRCV
jgi:hypothetical protein